MSNHPIFNYLAWIYRESSYEALRRAEQEKGAPVNLPEILRAFRQVSKKPIVAPHAITLCLLDFYWNDQILADRELNYVTLNPKYQHTEKNPTGFDVYSDRLARIYPGYDIDHLMRMVPIKGTPVLNYDYIKNLLLSKDLSRLGELKWIDENGGTFRFLDKSVSLEGKKTSFTSFPRSGNSVLRKLIELSSGVVTGADHRMELSLNL